MTELQEKRVTVRPCSQCGEPIWFCHECDGRPRKLSAAPVANGEFIIVAWEADYQGEKTTYVGFYRAEDDDGSPRYSRHFCWERT